MSLHIYVTLKPQLFIFICLHEKYFKRVLIVYLSEFLAVKISLCTHHTYI